MNASAFDRARGLLAEFKGDNYVFGMECLGKVGGLAASLGGRAAVVMGGVGKAWGQTAASAVQKSLAQAGVKVEGPVIAGSRPNAPLEDVYRLADSLRDVRADLIVAVGGGSVIDAVKAAAVLAACGWDASSPPSGDKSGDLERFFGVGKVTEMLKRTGRRLTPMLAVQTAASSAAHLTKYSNVTDVATAQKKLIIDDAVVPARALFDYAATTFMSPEFTADGAMDGLSHCLEVFYGAKGEAMEKVRSVCLLGIELIVQNVRAACRDGQDLAAREALGLATDLGGNAIMIGGTSGGHLTSFSLVDILPHGRACALMNPYYTVFFAPAIERQLHEVAGILARGGYLKTASDRLHGRELGLAVAEALQAVAASVGMATRLADVRGFSPVHIHRALEAAKNPQLESKLRNMPVPLSPATVDEYMGCVLAAAAAGDFASIKNMKM
jgi:alcohol dehydrogenase class IV